MDSLVFSCPHCGPDHVLLAVTPPIGVNTVEWRRHWKSVVIHPTCQCCGGVVRIACDGVSAESGGCVRATNISRPKIDATTVASGARTGGEAIYITGSALDVGALVVKFDGVPAQAVTNRTATRARVVTPIGRYYFRTAAEPHRMRLSNVAGYFNVGDVLHFSNGSAGVVKHVTTSTLIWIQFSAVNGPVAGLTGQTVSAQSGFGSVTGVEAVPFIAGEGVRGLTSGARGTFIAPLGVTAPTTSFAPNEVVQGDASGACVILGSPAYSGRVNITVENEYGQRQDGGTLVGGFTYL